MESQHWVTNWLMLAAAAVRRLSVRLSILFLVFHLFLRTTAHMCMCCQTVVSSFLRAPPILEVFLMEGDYQSDKSSASNLLFNG